MTTRSTCKQPIFPGELKAINGDWHVRAGDCVQATARRCAEICLEKALEVAELSIMAAGAVSMCAADIVGEFGLEVRNG